MVEDDDGLEGKVALAKLKNERLNQATISLSSNTQNEFMAPTLDGKPKD